MLRTTPILSLFVLAAAAAAQSTLVVPSAAAAVDGNSSTSYPFDVATSRLLYIYDSTHFTGNGVTFPIRISQIRYRANATAATWTGSTATLRMDLSTAPLDHAAISTVWDNNHGPDRATVWNGAWSIPAGSSTAGVPGPFSATVTFPTPFLYDPALGDLTIDTTSTGITIANTPTLDCVTTVGVANASRVYSLTSPPAVTATAWAGVLANVIEFTYTPAAGLYAGFSANVTSGLSPLAVQFTDQTFTSAAGGVLSWAWDFDGDNIVDSNLQNPSFVYANCGTYDVSLTVTDGTHAPSTLTRTAYVRTDEITAGFSYALAAAPNVVQFTDTTTPAATSWAWDFDGDNVTDSTLQNPVVAMPMCAASNVRLVATRSCRSSVATRAVFLSPANLPTTFVSTNGGATGYGVFFDLSIANPQGVSICAFDHNMSSAVGTPYTIDVYVTPTTHVGADATGSLWRLVGTGAGQSAGTGIASTTPLASPLYLSAGSYGMAIYYTGSSMRYEGTNTVPPVQNVFGNSDLVLTGGIVRTALWGGTLFTPRLWNGAIHYDTSTLSGTAGYGFFGAGCASALGITNLLHGNRPQLGQTLQVNLNNLPLSAAIMMTGWSNTSSSFGALPVDLGAFGAPGCAGRVSADATLFLFGSANAATWSFSVPNFAGLLGVQMYNQALVIDPAANALGAVVSDAAAMLLGN